MIAEKSELIFLQILFQVRRLYLSHCIDDVYLISICNYTACFFMNKLDSE